jgi:RNA polymerase sigma-70 factor (ECF subfamily)
LADVQNSGRLQNDPNVKCIDENTEHDALQAAIIKLSDRAQTLITMRYFSGLSYDDIAAILNITTGTARTATSRAIEELRSELREPL